MGEIIAIEVSGATVSRTAPLHGDPLRPSLTLAAFAYGVRLCNVVVGPFVAPAGTEFS